MKYPVTTYIGWFASAMAIAMYVSYIDQIKLNLHGEKGSVIQPLAATVNSLAWSLYGYLREKKEWPIVICNVPGVFLAGITFYTAL